MSEDEGIKGTIPPHIDEMLIALTGSIVTWWGRIEGCLVRDLITLRQQPKCADFAQRERFPVQTGGIIKQWETTRNLVFEDNPEKEHQTKTLATEMKECSLERNILVHSFWPYGNENDPTVLKLSSIKPQKGTHDTLQFTTVTIDLKSLDNLNERLFRLYTPVMVAGLQLSWGPDHLQRDRAVPKVGKGGE